MDELNFDFTEEKKPDEKEFVAVQKSYPPSFEGLWQSYREICRNAGSKATAFKSWQKMGKEWCHRNRLGPPEPGTESEAEWARHLRRGFDSLVINRRAAKKAGEKLQFMPHLSTWLNQERYDEQHETPTSELKAKSRQRSCSRCDYEYPQLLTEDRKPICRRCYEADWWQAEKAKYEIKFNHIPRKDGESDVELARRRLVSMPEGRLVLARMNNVKV